MFWNMIKYQLYDIGTILSKTSKNTTEEKITLNLFSILSVISSSDFSPNTQHIQDPCPHQHISNLCRQHHQSVRIHDQKWDGSVTKNFIGPLTLTLNEKKIRILWYYKNTSLIELN